MFIIVLIISVIILIFICLQSRLKDLLPLDHEKKSPYFNNDSYVIIKLAVTSRLISYCHKFQSSLLSDKFVRC